MGDVVVVVLVGDYGWVDVIGVVIEYWYWLVVFVVW